MNFDTLVFIFWAAGGGGGGRFRALLIWDRKRVLAAWIPDDPHRFFPHWRCFVFARIRKRLAILVKIFWLANFFDRESLTFFSNKNHILWTLTIVDGSSFLILACGRLWSVCVKLYQSEWLNKLQSIGAVNLAPIWQLSTSMLVSLQRNAWYAVWQLKFGWQVHEVGTKRARTIRFKKLNLEIRFGNQLDRDRIDRSVFIDAAEINWKEQNVWIIHNAYSVNIIQTPWRHWNLSGWSRTIIEQNAKAATR